MDNLKVRFLKEIMKAKPDYKNEFSDNELKDLINWGKKKNYIDGFIVSKAISGDLNFSAQKARVTMEGRDYLELLDTPVVREPIPVEVISPDLQAIAGQLQGLNEGQMEMVKLMAEHVEILDEMRFLKVDEIGMMKEKLIKMRKEDKEGKIPWDTLINFISLVASAVSKATTGV